MAFFRGLKRAFGFNADGDEVDDELDGVDGNASKHPYVNPFREHDGCRSAEQGTNVTGFTSATGGEPASAIQDNMKPSSDDHTSAAVESLEEKLKVSEVQRASLQERNGVLASRIASLEGKQKQLELENKSLLKKIKMLQVQSGGNVAPVQDSGGAKEIDMLTAEYKEKMSITNQLINDLRNDAVSKAKQIEELKSQLAGNNPLEMQLKQREKEIEKLKCNLCEANSNLEVAAEVEKKLEKFDQYKQKKEKEIAELNRQFDELHHRNAATLSDLREQLSKSKAENARLAKQLADQCKQASDTASKHNRRDIEVANRIDDLKHQLHRSLAEIEQQKKVIAQDAANLMEKESSLRSLRLDRENLSVQLEKLKAAFNETTGSQRMKSREQVIPDAVMVQGTGKENTGKMDESQIPPADIDDIDWLVPATTSSKPSDVSPQSTSSETRDSDEKQLSLF